MFSRIRTEYGQIFVNLIFTCWYFWFYFWKIFHFWSWFDLWNWPFVFPYIHKCFDLEASTHYLESISLFKVNNRNTKKRCEICSKSTKKHQNDISDLFTLKTLFLLILNIFHTLFLLFFILMLSSILDWSFSAWHLLKGHTYLNKPATFSFRFV